MRIQFAKLSPTQNVTVLVETPVPRADHAAVAAKLLAYDGVGGEQVGYIEPAADPRARLRLQMMGGEFCGNACMALGAYIARKDGLADGASADLLIEVSGSSAPVPVHIRREGRAWRGTVQMPLPEAIEQIDIDTDAGPKTVALARMPGIAHLILPAEMRLDEAQLRRRLPQWNAAIRADALGALTWDAAASSIDPLVYVPSTGTIVREHGCGSGTAAIGCWLAMRVGGDCRAAIRQPGGEITVDARVRDGRVADLSITGTIRLTAEGTAYIH